MLRSLESLAWLADGPVTSALLAGRFSSFTGTWTVSTPTAPGPIKAISGAGSGGLGADLVKDVANRPDCIVGFRYNISSLAGLTHILSFGTLGGFGESGLCSLWVNEAGELYVQRDLAGQQGEAAVIGSSSDHLTENAWQYIEIKAVFSDTVGSIDLQLDGVNVLSVSGVDTRSSDAWGPNCTQILFASPFARTASFGDIYVADLAAGQYTDFLGDTRLGILIPVSDSLVEMTPSSGGVNALMVDEIGPDEDATFNFTDQASAKDEFVHQAGIDPAAVIKAIQVTARGRKTDVATRLVEPLVRSGGVLGTGSPQSLATIYRSRQQVFELDPNGNIVWTPAAVNAALIGYRVTS